MLTSTVSWKSVVLTLFWVVLVLTLRFLLAEHLAELKLVLEAICFEMF